MASYPDNIRTCLKKYADFSDLADRAEFWHWTLTVWGICIVLASFLGDPELAPPSAWEPVLRIFQLLTLLPTFAVATRRLRDAGLRPYTLLWLLLPFIGWLVLFSSLVAGTTTEDKQ